MRTSSMALFLVLAVLVGCTATERPAAASGPAQRGGKADGLEPCEDDEAEGCTYDDLLAILGAEDAFQPPAIARENGGDQLDARLVTVPVDPDDDFRELGRVVEAKVDEVLAERFDYDEEEFPGDGIFQFLGPTSDVHAELAFGWRDERIREALLDTLRDEAARERARAIMAGLSARYAMARIYDLGAEYIGSDLFFINTKYNPNPRFTTIELHATYY